MVMVNDKKVFVGNQTSYLEWLNKEYVREEGDDKGGDPFGGLGVAKHDAIHEQEEAGDSYAANDQNPSKEYCPPWQSKFLLFPARGEHCECSRKGKDEGALSVSKACD